MSNNQNKGMQHIYDGLQTDDALQKKEAELIETINNILRNEDETSKINRKTKLNDAYCLPTMDSLADYLDKKYTLIEKDKNGKEKIIRNDADNLTLIIRTWSKYHKDTSVSVDGWLINGIFETFKGFIESIKQRSFTDRALGRNKEGKD